MQRLERVEVGRVVAGVERALEAALAEQVCDCGALVGADGRAQLEHLAAEPGDEALVARAGRDRFEHRQRFGFVLGAAVVEGDGQRLPLDVVPVDGRGEVLQPAAPLGGPRFELEPVLADVDELVQPDDATRVGAGAAADAGDEGVAAVEPAQLGARLLGNRRVVWHRDDRREDAVDVEQERRPAGLLGEARQQGVVAVHRPRIRAVSLKLVAIGLVAGLFSALFGVGGGIVIVPLLILVAGFDGRVATGTSLAAIGITALAGTILYSFEGHVEVAHAALVGIPATVGAVLGTTIQQRVSARILSLAFAVLLASIAVWLLVG